MTNELKSNPAGDARAQLQSIHRSLRQTSVAEKSARSKPTAAIYENEEDPWVSIILRSYNEAWALKGTLEAIQSQEYANWELIVIDSGSTDGSDALIRAARPRVYIRIKPSEYNPARVLNQGMGLARSRYGIFINADATPQGPGWLRPLARALRNPRTAAVFGRQIPRPDCQAVYAHDYERCFGPGRESESWDHFFSMANSGLRKDVWSLRGFQEAMQYSEDDEYTRWCKKRGYRVEFCPDSVAMHSHNYTPEEAAKRSCGEGEALAAVWPGRRSDFHWTRSVLLGWINDSRRDAQYCLRRGRMREWPHAVRIRWNQRTAKWKGFHSGWVKYHRAQNMPLPAMNPS